MSLPRGGGKIDGLVYIGEVSNLHVNGGKPVPLYDIAPRTDGLPDINTVEGWDRLRHDLSEQRLLKALGRQPSENEIQAEMERNAQEARRIIENAAQLSASNMKGEQT